MSLKIITYTMLMSIKSIFLILIDEFSIFHHQNMIDQGTLELWTKGFWEKIGWRLQWRWLILIRNEISGGWWLLCAECEIKRTKYSQKKLASHYLTFQQFSTSGEILRESQKFKLNNSSEELLRDEQLVCNWEIFFFFQVCVKVLGVFEF